MIGYNYDLIFFFISFKRLSDREWGVEEHSVNPPFFPPLFFSNVPSEIVRIFAVRNFSQDYNRDLVVDSESRKEC